MHSINKNNIDKVVFLTPFKGNISLLNKSIKYLLDEISEDDKWIIVLDNLKENNLKNINQDKRITLLKYRGLEGAGNARNYGLDYIIKNNLKNFLLWPIDGDDQLIKGSRSIVVKEFNNLSYSMMSFGIIKIYKKYKLEQNLSDEKTYRDLLKKYSTPCGSTILRVKESNILKKIRFGKRKRANDQLFFLTAANYFKKCFFHRKPILLNFCVDRNSLSHKKWKQPFYKFFVFVDLGLRINEIFFYFFEYLKFNLYRYFQKNSSIIKYER